MLNYDLIVIGFGKAGKTLAAKMNAAGKKVAVIERSKARDTVDRAIEKHEMKNAEESLPMWEEPSAFV